MKYSKLCLLAILISTLSIALPAQNVGIGTTTPSAKLHVQEGNLKIRNTNRPWLIFDHPAGMLNGGIQWWQDSVVEMELFYNDFNESLRFRDTHSGLYRLILTRSGNLVALGVLDLDTPPPPHVTGGGTRMMWYPEKAAFRAGRVAGTHWNKDSVGYYSAAFGSNVKAKGDGSLALGFENSASGSGSIATGNNTLASGVRSATFGGGTTASGAHTIAMGLFTRAVAAHSVAMGRYNVGGGTGNDWIETDPVFEIGMGTSNATRENAMMIRKDGAAVWGGHVEDMNPNGPPASGAGARMMWYPNKAAFRAGLLDDAGQHPFAWDKDSVGFQSVAMGTNVKASGLSSVALGRYTTASATGSLATGSSTTALGTYSTAMGYGTQADARVSFAIGRFNIGGGTNDWIATDPLFEIGIGSSDTSRGNAITVLKNGRMGVGIESPQHLFHAVSDTENRTGYFFNTKNTSEATFGLYAGAFGTGSGNKFGGAFDASGGTGTNSGIRVTAIDGSTNIAVYGSASGGSTNWAAHFDNGYVIVGDRIGVGTTTPQFGVHAESGSLLRTGYFYNNTNSASTTYGLYAGAFGVGSGDKRGGSFEAFGGSGTNVAVRGLANNGATNIALYGSASGGTTNWAAHFDDGYVIVDERVGIGTTTPQHAVHAQSSSLLRTGYFYNSTSSASTTFGVYGGAFGTGSGAKRGGSFEAFGGTGTNIGMRTIAANGVVNIGVYSTASGGTTNWAAHFEDGNVIMENGNVGIGTATPAAKLHVIGNLQIGSAEQLADAGGFTISCNSIFRPTVDDDLSLGTSSFRWSSLWAANGTIQTSDARDKTDIHEIQYGLDEIMHMKPVSFRWKSGKHQSTKLGLIAQEMLEVIPEVVVKEEWSRNEDGDMQKAVLDHYGMYYADLIPVLVKGIQEQQAIIEAQQEQIDELRQVIGVLTKKEIKK